VTYASKPTNYTQKIGYNIFPHISLMAPFSKEKERKEKKRKERKEKRKSKGT
jgi:hypothetical protein